MDRPFILCGLGRIGWRVLEHLEAGNFPVVVIDTKCAADDPRLGKVRLVRGDCQRAEALVEAGVHGARGVAVVTSDDLVNITTALAARQLNPEVRIVVRMVNPSLLARLGKVVGNVFALSTADLTGPLLALTALTGQALGAFRLEGAEGSLYQVAEVIVQTNSALRGRSLAETAARHRVVVLAHLPAQGSARLLLDVDHAAPARPGDRLVVCGDPRDLAPLVAAGTEEIATPVLWAGWLRRTGRALARTVREVDLPVKICTGVLVGVILVSTLVMVLGVHKYSLADALFRTISVMATGADMHEQDFDSDWQKVFAATLRILGAALTAAFTAIVTNYLLRAHLFGALEVRRLPDGGHVVVCGLGNIGFRVVEELLHSDERVVAVERVGDNPFVTTARRLGVPVLLGDATVREVLRQAHAPTARAVVAATTNDLANLEIALLARELNPQQRVVLCLADASLAQSLREAANIRLSLSVPALAGPAFVAALFGDRVLSVFLFHARPFAALDLLIQAGESRLAGETVRSVAIDYGLVPLAVMTPDGERQHEPLEARLEPGWRLLAILGLHDLGRLLRRVPLPCDWNVELTAVPETTRPRVAAILKDLRGVEAEAAEKVLDHAPVMVGRNLTRGQAEDLLVRLRREQVEGTARREG